MPVDTNSSSGTHWYTTGLQTTSTNVFSFEFEPPTRAQRVWYWFRRHDAAFAWAWRAVVLALLVIHL